MKWSDMSPRERDALVAVNVMGWEVVRGTVVPPGYESWSKPEVPSYTTDISAAWEVVEKMDEWIVQRARDGDYWVTVRFGESWYLSGWVKSAPEAICLAALKAVGVDVD
jgi:hypothetical protein